MTTAPSRSATFCSAALAFLVLASTRARADYALPAVEERLVLLVDIAEATIDTDAETRRDVLSIKGVAARLPIDRFWMQDRIWSAGICVGVPDSNERSAAFRIRETRRAIARKEPARLLVELVRTAGSDRFIVSYLKAIDAETEFRRYFPAEPGVDAIELGLPRAPANAREFVEELERRTKEAIERLESRVSGKSSGTTPRQ